MIERLKEIGRIDGTATFIDASKEKEKNFSFYGTRSIPSAGGGFEINGHELEIGDIVLMQPKSQYREWWSNFTSYQHAALYVGNGNFLQAYGPNTPSGYKAVGGIDKF